MEIEAKLKLESHEPLRALLVRLGARRVGRYKETNHIFDHPVLQLRTSGQGLRVREVETLEGEPQVPTVTYKGKVTRGAFKKRPELQFPTAQPGDAIGVFGALGFTRLLSFEKVRESWVLQDCQVDLDELPRLGSFVEVEGPSEQAVANLLMRLELRGSNHITSSYVGMLLTHCRNAGLSDTQVRF